MPVACPSSLQRDQKGQAEGVGEALDRKKPPDKISERIAIAALPAADYASSLAGSSQSRIPADAATRELSRIREILHERASEAVAGEDADLALAKRLQAEELRHHRLAVPTAKKRTASTLDQFFKKQRP